VKNRIAFATLALLGIISLPVLSPPAHLAHREFTGFAATTWQGQSPANSQPAMRLESMYVAKETTGTLFENVVAVLQKKYYDKRFREDTLPGLVSQYSEKARRAATLGEQRLVVHEFLSHIPASHLGLLSMQTHRYVFNDLQGRAYPTFGFQLVEVKGEFYAFAVLEGGPAQRAGLMAWDRIASIDGAQVKASPRLDWRSDDAYIPDDRDPAVHYLTANQGDRILLKVERHRGKTLDLTVPAEDYSAFAAARASAQIHKVGDRTVGYLHFWYVHMTGVPELLKEKLEGEFGSCDAIVLDLRGRGGNGVIISKIVDILRADNSSRHRPIVALVDRQSRSAKDVLAYELKKNGVARLVGERTAGAVIPASFADVGYETVLMFPSFKLPGYTDILELKPVEPDVFVERAGPFSAGEDTILKAGINEALNLLKGAVKSASAK
jgi:carboxyl-terminal processing protease